MNELIKTMREWNIDFEAQRYLEQAHQRDLDAELEVLATQKSEEKFKDKMESFRVEVVKATNEKFILKKGVDLSQISPLLNTSVEVDGRILERDDFFQDKYTNDHITEDQRLYYDDIHLKWFIRNKYGDPLLISNFVVTACVIINASGPGICQYLVVFLLGSERPLVFKNGIVKLSDLIEQTQFYSRGSSFRSRQIYQESFLRSIKMCRYVLFLNIPNHMGWNIVGGTTRRFLSSEDRIRGIDGIFSKCDADIPKKDGMRNVFNDIILLPTERSFNQIVVDYNEIVPNTMSLKVGTVMAVMSNLLPFYKDENLTQDSFWVVESAYNESMQAMISVLKNNNHSSLNINNSSDRVNAINEMMMRSVDCTCLIRHTGCIEQKYDLDKTLKLICNRLGDGLEESRSVYVLLIDNASIIPEDLPFYCLSVPEKLKMNNVTDVQRIMGELEYVLLKFAEQNYESMVIIIKECIERAKALFKDTPQDAVNQSSIMFLATAFLLKKMGVLSDTDINDMTHWLEETASSSASISDVLCESFWEAINEVILSGELTIKRQQAPPFYSLGIGNAFVADTDGSINLDAETFDRILLPKIKTTTKRNKILQALADNGYLIYTKDHKRDLKVKLANGVQRKLRCYSLSDELLDNESRMLVEESRISDIFHNTEKSIDNFYAFIQHDYFNKAAGQVITDYKKINPFICVTGGPGSRKSTFLMMQALQRAMNDDTVIVLDTSNSFSLQELYEHGIPKKIVDKYFIFWDVCSEGWPVDLMDFSKSASKEEMISVIYSLLVSGTHLSGESQLSILTNKISAMLDDVSKQKWSEKKDISCICDYFDQTDADEKKVYNRLKALFCHVNTVDTIPQKWQDFLNYRGKIIVFSNGGNVSNADVNVMDVIFDSLYSYKDKHRENSLTVIMDEVQKMNLRSNAPLNTLLSLGRKSNISMIIASQIFSKGYDNLGRIEGYCGTKIFCRPMDNCIDTVSKITGISEEELQMFEDGYCAVMGSIYSEYYNKNIPMKTAVCGYIYRLPELGEYKDYTEEFEQP